MDDSHNDFNTLTPDEIADPTTFSGPDVTRGNVVFVIPLDAPIPSELADVEVPTGTLYQRLAPLCQKERDRFAFVPVSGAELLHLDRAWRLLQVAKKVFVLSDLPGARYDVMFTQAVRQIGLPKLEWPAVSEALASQAIARQRMSDASPWRLKDQDLTKPGRRLPRSVSLDAQPLEEPVSDEDPA